jgi:DNA-binding SARP family transcriptional activator/tetratricopeptide (TPR) repeat protein
MDTGLEFCLLGPLAVRSGGATVLVPRGKQRVLLASLLLSAGQAVSVDELAETLWNSAPPPSAPVTVRNHVRRLRSTLGEIGWSRIRTHPGGYLIKVGSDELDVLRCESLLREALDASRSGRHADAAAGLRTALSLWRGQPLADVPSDVLAVREIPRLAEMHMQALEAHIDADLHLGHHSAAISELRQLTAANPLREKLHALLMLALYRDSQQAAALAAYQSARQVLVEELGAEPGPELRRMHQQILSADVALAAQCRIGQPAGPSGSTDTGSRTGILLTAQLPRAPWHFVGRAAELTVLADMHDRADSAPTEAISVICGTAGVGKTALALRWAHHVVGRFPDGLLYVDLQGFAPSGLPLTAAESIRHLLDSLGMARERIPADQAAQATLYRGLLAGRRVLVILDNARDPAQVRPLLPGSPGCVVLITSRNQLTGLAAAEGANLIILDVLTAQEAREMLEGRLGRDRVAIAPAEVTDLIDLCARLPLALSVAAARAAGRPGLPLAALAAELRDAQARLDGLATGDIATDLRTVLSWSCQQLSGPAARMFQMLGIHPGPDISEPAAASLAGLPLQQARRALAELCRASLITEHAAGRFAFHDLLRAYAAELAHSCETDASRSEAVGRVLDHYLHTAYSAALLLNPYRETVTLSPPRPSVQQEEQHSPQQALAWFQAERFVLLAVIGRAADAGFLAQAGQLAWAAATFLSGQGFWHEQVATQTIALAAAQSLGDLSAQAHAHHFLGQAHMLIGAHAEATRQLNAALRLGQQLGSSRIQAREHGTIATVCGMQGHSAEALKRAREALRLSRAAGHRFGEAHSLNAIGWHLIQVGEYQKALTSCEQALALYAELRYAQGMAATLDSLGYAHYHLGNYAQAVARYREAINALEGMGDRDDQAEYLTHLGDAYQAAGNRNAARQAWQQAMEILDDLQTPAAALVRSRLEEG